MLAHNIKEVLSIVPEALDFVKEASLEQDFPVDSRDSAAASYLTAAYLIKRAGKVIDVDILKRLEKAASLYGVKEQLDAFIPRFTPVIKEAELDIKTVEAMFEGDLCGFLNIEKAASQATELMLKYASKVTSGEVLRYSGNAYLDKEAAVYSLANRFYATKESFPSFIKIARIINDEVREDDFAAIGDICRTVTYLDKQAGLDLIGFNFYREALLTKEAAVSGLVVNLNGLPVPYAKIIALGKDRIGSYLGKDVGDAMKGDISDKYMLEALPKPTQAMLQNILKNV